MLYDTHAHLDAAKLYPQIEQVLARAQAAGLGLINTIGCDWKSSLLSLRLAERFSTPQLQIYAAVGYHPTDSGELNDELLERLFEQAQSPRCVAWGEIGLDYYWPEPTREWQKQTFVKQIDAAAQLQLPLIIHDREAHNDLLTILKQERSKLHGGVLHCCSCSWEMAKECLKLGFYLSFAGPLTYHNARVAREVAEQAPLERLLVETDCPYLAPEPLRGKRNEPAYVLHTVSRLAQLRGLDADEMGQICYDNGRRLFGV